MARLLRTLGIALGLPGAAYYGKVGYDVHLASQEADRIDSQREAESTAATHAQSKLEREIAHLASLEEKLERLDKASHFDLNKWDVQISEAKARLDRLVKDREVAAQQSAQLLEDMDDARGRRTSLEAQKAKHEENLKDVAVKDIAEWLWKAPFGLLAHDAGNPRLFEYGNQMALELFETDFEELAGTPSTRSADNEVEVMVVQADRSQALAAALEKGYITGYSGWRRSFQGTRFLIKDAILFNVMSPTGEVIGQAAQLNGWEKEGAETSEVQGH
ncbi:hypothetical protein QBZ16_004718 [Prototheca wickerhamii]|uniref:MEKHLA domain-containing protein n=1 Tax=Prototheca wickerhamii TaxID=3111 RepID=A0AAD9MGK0_PROWI|nr:hypothetical protein QBZ16_004718 [Prototheca wickerhamii]